MRPAPRFLLIIAILALAVLAAGCAAQGSPPPGAAQPLAVDPTTFALIRYERTGGPEDSNQQAVMYLDGHVVLSDAGQDPVTFQLSQAVQDQIDAAFDATDFYRNVHTVEEQPDAPDGGYSYQLSRNSLIVQGSLATVDGAIPDWAQPLIPLLNNLLLSPDPATVKPYVADEPLVTATRAGESAPEPDLVLVQFTRSGPQGEERVLVNLNRSFSVARGGQVSEGELTREELAALLAALEGANLRQNRGDYLGEAACQDCLTYELIYRNLFGEYTVRSTEETTPDWLEPVLQQINEAFLPDDVVVLAPPTPRATASPTRALLIVAATDTPTATPTATPLPSPTPTTEPNAPTAALPATPAVAESYSTLDFLADLANLGVQVEVAPGRVAKPYLSTYGLIVRVDGEPVQVFQYPDEARLLADIDGLDATASTIDGAALAWPAAPHFWRKGPLLVLLVSDEAYFADLISQTLGPPFAGQ